MEEAGRLGARMGRNPDCQIEAVIQEEGLLADNQQLVRGIIKEILLMYIFKENKRENVAFLLWER